jgi:NADP+-dependent farnesol dehydrogenase
MTSNLLVEDDAENCRRMFELNVIASCTCLKDAISLMRSSTGRGQIIILNSVLGHRVPDIPFPIKPTFGVYPATKFALTGLCQTLRQELNYLRLPIKVTSISPGMVDTEILNSMNQDLVKMLPKLKAEDVAEAVLFSSNTPDRVRIDEIILNPMLC